jgi:hypothetical protein
VAIGATPPSSAAQPRQIEDRQRAFIGFDQAGAAGTPTALG